MTSKKDEVKRVPLIDGIDVGMRMVFALATQGMPMSLGEISRAADVPPSKTHRFLVSLCRSGMLEQDQRSNNYDLGPLAVSLGLAAQRRLPEFRLASEALNRLHKRTSVASSAVAWGRWGPVVAAHRINLASVTLNTRVGSVLPLTTSSSGRLFAAWLPEEITRPFIEREFAGVPEPRSNGKTISRPDFQKLLTRIRRVGLSHVSGDLVVGVDAVAVPVFNAEGTMVMALTLLAPCNTLDLSLGGTACNALLEESAIFSRQLATQEQSSQ